MRKRFLQSLYIVAALVVSTGLVSRASAQATLPLYDPFNYAAAQPLVNGTNGVNGGVWIPLGGNTVTTTEVQTGSLSFAGLPAPQGNKVRLLNGSNYIDPGFDLATTVSSGVIYASMILNVVNEGTNTTTGDYFFAFAPAGGTDYRTRLYLRRGSAAGKFQLGMRTHSSDSGTAWQTGEQDSGTPIFVVAAYQFNTGSTTDDVGLIYINPTLGQPTPPTATITGASGTDTNNIGRVTLRQGSSVTTQIVEVDELRVSTSWTDVTPSNAAVGDWSLY
ncbi:MAG: hypothetical protein KatS3mg130_1355 [Candidatus Sumerlaea sp.]|nr:MAG: hypothetical protein KatS3mg130_1355 [Candidatus Sumerlaea sp.]